jgi:serine/threonine protein kinase
MNREAENLFHELADLPAEQRREYYVREHVPRDVSGEVEALLRFDTGSDHALADCVAGSAERTLQQRASPQPGARCGPYRLTRLLGRGGMGAVYLGERDDGEVEQRAAIKLLRYGGNEPWFQDRFLRERRILAALSHTGIARLLDAGHTAEGQPFLAMDYIDGQPVDVYAQKLDLRGKLALFLEICDAVSYAHRNLIIHRDLKPSNILVNRSGEPKLLDFGIAKILSEAHNDGSPSPDRTQTRERLLTPDFASPEQVRGGAQTTATDIYSLGAVLYKLLTGSSPHSFAGDAPGEIEAAICTRDPLAPSRANREIPRDLDYILGKALRKEPGERYASVDALADDLRAFLEWRPIRARSGNVWYRARKFMRRYRLPVLAAVLTVAGLSVGLYVANRERAISQRRFEQVRRIANKALALDNVIRDLAGGTKAREEIVSMSEEYLSGLANEARSDQDLAYEVADGYMHLALIQGTPTSANLGRPADAEASLKKADALLEAILKTSPRNRKALSAAAETEHNLMILAETEHRGDAESGHRHEKALEYASRAAAHIDAFLAVPPVSATDKRDAARLLSNIALAHKNLHLHPASIRYARRAAEIGRSSGGDIVVSNALSVQADSLRLSGDLDGAVRAIQEATALVEKAAFPNERARRNTLFNVLWREGVILGEPDLSLDRTADAIAVLRRAYELTEAGAEQDLNDANVRIVLASAARELGPLLTIGDPKQALAIYDHALLRLREARNNHARRSEAALLAGSSYALRRLNRAGEARQRIDLAIRLLREMNEYPEDRIDPDSDAETVHAALGDHFAETGEPAQAAETFRELLAKIAAFKPDLANDLRNAVRVAGIEKTLAVIDRRMANREEANAMTASQIELWRGWLGKLPGNPFVLRQLSAASAAN